MSQPAPTTQNLPALIAQRELALRAAMPASVNQDRFMRVLMDTLNSNPDLRNPAKADPRSVIDACAKAAKDGLVIDGREAALVLFKGAATYIPMVAGLRKLIFQSGQVATLETGIVYEAEMEERFDYQAGTDGFLRHRPLLVGERGKPLVAYSVAKMKTGENSVEVMRWDDIQRVAKNSPIWAQHPGEMARKTVLRRHFKSLPSSADADRAFESMDEIYRDETGEVQPGEVSTPTKQAGGARARLQAVRAEPEPELPPHDAETGEIVPEDDPF